MKRLILTTVPALLAIAALSGCASGGTRHVESGGSRTVLNVNEMNVHDWNMPADTMINSLIAKMINTGRLVSSRPGQPAILAISRIANNTGRQIDTDLLIKKIRIALNDTGKVVTDTTVNLDPNQIEDPLAEQAKASGQVPATRYADYTLSGKIIESATRAGNVRESSYAFQLSLTSRDGLAVWEEEEVITKQGKRSSVGF